MTKKFEIIFTTIKLIREENIKIEVVKVNLNSSKYFVLRTKDGQDDIKFASKCETFSKLENSIIKTIKTLYGS